MIALWPGALLLLIPASLAATVTTGDVIGYAVESGKTYTASCDDAYSFTSLSDTLPICTNTYNGKQTSYSLFYFFSCAGSTLVKASAEGTQGNVQTSTLATYDCINSCATIPIFQTNGSATITPTFGLAVCLSTDTMYTTETRVAGVDGSLPLDVKSLYRPALAPNTAAPSGTGGAGSSGGGSSSNKTPVIAGAVVGSVVGVGLLVGAFFLGRRGVFRKKAKPTPDEGIPMGGKPGFGPNDGLGKPAGPSELAQAEPRVPSEMMAHTDPERHELGDVGRAAGLSEVPNTERAPELDSQQRHEVPNTSIHQRFHELAS